MTADEATVVLATGRQMRRADPESHVLLAALDQLGVGAVIEPWDELRDWSLARLVMVRTPWDYFQRREEFLAWAERTALVTKVVNSPRILSWSSHKGYLLELERVGIPILPTVLVPADTSPVEQARLLDQFHGELVVKPAVSVGAIGLVRASGPAAGALHLASLLESGDALLQSFEPSVVEYGELSLVFFEENFSHAVRKTPAKGDFRVQLHYGGSVVPSQPTLGQLEVAIAALAVAPGPTSYARVDLIGPPDEPKVMELELIDPELFLGQDTDAPLRLARHLCSLLR
jgi:glutathione synthase/RimK-type ligase-like ATP-grasp enzyme